MELIGCNLRPFFIMPCSARLLPVKDASSSLQMSMKKKETLIETLRHLRPISEGGPGDHAEGISIERATGFQSQQNNWFVKAFHQCPVLKMTRRPRSSELYCNVVACRDDLVFISQTSKRSTDNLKYSK